MRTKDSSPQQLSDINPTATGPADLLDPTQEVFEVESDNYIVLQLGERHSSELHLLGLPVGPPNRKGIARAYSRKA
jgi:hypothetical protein